MAVEFVASEFSGTPESADIAIDVPAGATDGVTYVVWVIQYVDGTGENSPNISGTDWEVLADNEFPVHVVVLGKPWESGETDYALPWTGGSHYVNTHLLLFDGVDFTDPVADIEIDNADAPPPFVIPSVTAGADDSMQLACLVTESPPDGPALSGWSLREQSYPGGGSNRQLTTYDRPVDTGATGSTSGGTSHHWLALTLVLNPDGGGGGGLVSEGIGVGVCGVSAIGRAAPRFDGVWEGWAHAALIGQFSKKSERTGVAVVGAAAVGRRAAVSTRPGVAVGQSVEVGSRSPVSAARGVSAAQTRLAGARAPVSAGRGVAPAQACALGQRSMLSTARGVVLVTSEVRGQPVAIVQGSAFGISPASGFVLGRALAIAQRVGLAPSAVQATARAAQRQERTGLVLVGAADVGAGLASSAGGGLGVALGAAAAVGRRELVSVARGVAAGQGAAVGVSHAVSQRNGLAVASALLGGAPIAVVTRNGVVLVGAAGIGDADPMGAGVGVGLMPGYGVALGRRDVRSVGQGVATSQAALVARSQAITTRNGLSVVHGFGGGRAASYALVVADGLGVSGGYLIAASVNAPKPIPRFTLVGLERGVPLFTLVRVEK